jgi:hypothetical protein
MTWLIVGSVIAWGLGLVVLLSLCKAGSVGEWYR